MDEKAFGRLKVLGGSGEQDLLGGFRYSSPMWRFPEIGVPPNHPFNWDFPHYTPTILDTPIYGTPYISVPLSAG